MLFLISAQLVTPRSKIPAVAVVTSLSYTAGKWLILALTCSSPRPVLSTAVPKRWTSTECRILQAHPSCKMNKICDTLAKIPTVNYSQQSQPSLVSTPKVREKRVNTKYTKLITDSSKEKFCASIRIGLSTVNPTFKANS